VAEVKDGKSDVIHLIRGKEIDDLTNGKARLFKFPSLPFSLEVAGYMDNAQPVSITERAPDKEELIADGYYLIGKPDEKSAEANTAACYARVVDTAGKKGPPFILAGASFYPYTVKVGDRVFTVDMHKRLWPMPFTLNLDKFTAAFHPGTMMPSKFVSEVTRVENGSKVKLTIQMNEPMRYEGLTFFQASYGPKDAAPGQKLFSIFEVVKNPADKWPEYSLYIVAFGMAVTFLTKLISFLAAQSRKKRYVKTN
jgi:hypothetical protein